MNVEPTESQQHHKLDPIDEQMSQTARTMMRRGSKSLPASPLGSPKSIRKVNPYFTTGLAGQTSGTSGSGAGGWFFSGLLGIQRDTTISGSVSSQIDEVDDEVYDKHLTNTVPTSQTITASSNAEKHHTVLTAKPSQLREMNFWSPTSM